MTKLMNKQQIYMEKMLALLLLVFSIALLLGEERRDYLYGEPPPPSQPLPKKDYISGSDHRKKGKK